MDSLQIIAVLLQDGVTTGAIYALLGMALVLVFAVTRIVFFPQGEMVSYGALTLVWLQNGQVPGTVWLMLAASLAAGAAEAVSVLREGQRGRLLGIAVKQAVLPALVALLVVWGAPRGWPLGVQCALSITLVTLLGPSLYRLVYQPMAQASVLVLMIVSVGLHFVLVGLALIFFGVDGFRTPALWDARFEVAGLNVTGQSLVVLSATGLLVLLMAVGFGHTLYGKALRAAASNSVGARLVAISVPFSGRLSFGIAAFVGALCGVLIAPLVTIYYDSGLLIGLKGFVSSIIGGMVSYPMTLIGALGIGIVESFTSFTASAYKESIIFLLVLPVLLWLSLRGGGHEEEHA